MTSQQKRLLASVGLVDLSLVLLWLAGIIELDATGDGSPDDWNLPVAFFGFLAAGGAVVLSWTDRRARRAVGLTLVTVAAAMVVFGLNVEGFRFVYTPFEAEYVILTVVIALAGIGMAAPFRLFAYVVIAAVFAALGLQVGYVGGQEVCGPDADDCAFAAASSLFVAAVGVLLVLIVVGVIESRRAALRKLPRRTSAGGQGQR